MKKIYFATILFVGMFFIVGLNANAGQEKVDVCHITGMADIDGDGVDDTQVGHIITIADPAYDSHIAHGDPELYILAPELGEDVCIPDVNVTCTTWTPEELDAIGTYGYGVIEDDQTFWPENEENEECSEVTGEWNYIIGDVESDGMTTKLARAQVEYGCKFNSTTSSWGIVYHAFYHTMDESPYGELRSAEISSAEYHVCKSDIEDHVICPIPGWQQAIDVVIDHYGQGSNPIVFDVDECTEFYEIGYTSSTALGYDSSCEDIDYEMVACLTGWPDFAPPDTCGGDYDKYCMMAYSPGCGDGTDIVDITEWYVPPIPGGGTPEGWLTEAEYNSCRNELRSALCNAGLLDCQ